MVDEVHLHAGYAPVRSVSATFPLRRAASRRRRRGVVQLAGLPALLTTAQLAGVVDLAPTLPIYCLLCAVIIVLDARVRSLPTIALLSAPAAVFLVLRLLAIDEWPSGGPATVVTELVAIGLTALLARRVGRNIEEFESAGERLLATDISCRYCRKPTRYRREMSFNGSGLPVARSWESSCGSVLRAFRSRSSHSTSF